MKIIRTVAELRRLDRPPTALVPTMGAFHEGHLQLMRDARSEADHVTVSLFVNPTQFKAGEDFDRYPRDFGRDASLAERAGVDVLFAPSVDEVYPRRTSTIHIREVTDTFEGLHRPGHFDGVTTVVGKLFNMVQPAVALFGQKDLQQCMVIRRMVDDLNFPLRLAIRPTVREADGLAMSSRNVYLSPDERKNAPALYAALRTIREFLPSNPANLAGLLAKAAADLAEHCFTLDYLDAVDVDTFQPVAIPNERTALVVAAKIGTTRLIDNLLLFSDQL